MMKKDHNILKEIQEISPLLADLHGINVFHVPEGYFDSISDNVLDNIKASNIPAFEKNSPQHVPEGYFENLSHNILQRIKGESVDEENELHAYPAIMADGKQQVFSVPDGYFEHLPETILARIKESQTTKVISISRKVRRYAAAAVIAVGLFVTSYFVINQRSDVNGFAVINKNTVPDPAALKYNSAKSFEQGIASLSEDEIVDYLEEHGNILDNDLLLKNTDGSGLPDATDYLLNEDALTNYLNKINDKGFDKQ